jgi:hypothetical protein
MERWDGEKRQTVRTVQMSVAAAILGAMAVIAGCGHTGPNASGAAGAGSSSSPSSNPSGGVTVTGKNLNLSAEQNGKVYDVQKGTTLFVYLRGTPAQMWKPITVSSDALQPAASGKMALMLGETGASFLAAKPGTAIISSTRPLCKSSSSGTMSPGGTAQCGVIQSYRVTVVVLG